MSFHVPLFVAVCLAASLPASAQSILLSGPDSLRDWTTVRGAPVPERWEIDDEGAIHLAAGEGRGGNIVSAELYGDFILDFEWKIAEGGNSGIKYRVRDFAGRTLGCEYQILDDDNHLDGLAGKTSTGSLYDLYAPQAGSYVRPPGEYNQGRIVVCGHHLEHWLNGELILAAEVGSWQWFANKADSKFAEIDGFGENRLGRIMLTDHNSEVWYRNLKLTPLSGCVASYCAPPAKLRCPPPRRRLLFRRRR